MKFILQDTSWCGNVIPYLTSFMYIQNITNKQFSNNCILRFIHFNHMYVVFKELDRWLIIFIPSTLNTLLLLPGELLGIVPPIVVALHWQWFYCKYTSFNCNPVHDRIFLLQLHCLSSSANHLPTSMQNISTQTIPHAIDNLLISVLWWWSIQHSASGSCIGTLEQWCTL